MLPNHPYCDAAREASKAILATAGPCTFGWLTRVRI